MRDRYVAQHTVKIKAPPPHRGSLPLPHTPFIAPHQIDFFWATRELAVPPLAGRSLARYALYPGALYDTCSRSIKSRCIDCDPMDL